MLNLFQNQPNPLLDVAQRQGLVTPEIQKQLAQRQQQMGLLALANVASQMKKGQPLIPQLAQATSAYVGAREQGINQVLGDLLKARQLESQLLTQKRQQQDFARREAFRATLPPDQQALFDINAPEFVKQMGSFQGIKYNPEMTSLVRQVYPNFDPRNPSEEGIALANEFQSTVSPNEQAQIRTENSKARFEGRQTVPVPPTREDILKKYLKKSFAPVSMTINEKPVTVTNKAVSDTQYKDITGEIPNVSSDNLRQVASTEIGYLNKSKLLEGLSPKDKQARIAKLAGERTKALGLLKKTVEDAINIRGLSKYLRTHQTDEDTKLIDYITTGSKNEVMMALERAGEKVRGLYHPDSIAAKAELDTIKTKLFLKVVAEMRAMSPTGGALGSVTEREIEKVENSVTALMEGMTPEALTKNLKELESIVEQATMNIIEAFEEDFGTVPGIREALQKPYTFKVPQTFENRTDIKIKRK